MNIEEREQKLSYYGYVIHELFCLAMEKTSCWLETLVKKYLLQKVGVGVCLTKAKGEGPGFLRLC